MTGFLDRLAARSLGPGPAAAAVPVVLPRALSMFEPLPTTWSADTTADVTFVDTPDGTTLPTGTAHGEPAAVLTATSQERPASQPQPQPRSRGEDAAARPGDRLPVAQDVPATGVPWREGQGDDHRLTEGHIGGHAPAMRGAVMPSPSLPAVAEPVARTDRPTAAPASPPQAADPVDVAPPAASAPRHAAPATRETRLPGAPPNVIRAAEREAPDPSPARRVVMPGDRAASVAGVLNAPAPVGSWAALQPVTRGRSPAVEQDVTAHREPDVHVTIGRLEIRAMDPPATAPPARSRPAPAPTLGLDAYLRHRRAEGGRR